MRQPSGVGWWHQHRIDISSVIDETEWWVQILDRWENDVDGEFACRIFTAAKYSLIPRASNWFNRMRPEPMASVVSAHPSEMTIIGIF